MISLFFHWLHLVAAIFWIGGLAFTLISLAPSLSQIEFLQRGKLLKLVMKRFLHIVWGSIAVIVATGLYRVFVVNAMTSLDSFTASGYGHLLLTKIGLVIVMIALAAWVTYGLFPRVSKHIDEHTEKQTPACVECGKLLKKTRRIMWTVLVLGIIVILVAARLRGA